nr:SRPBCC domain-containing protein [uncultured Nocardioides sp.]
MPVTDVQHDLDALTLTITADFAAPVERVWEVYADPRQLERVWGPPGYPATFVDHDLVPGGRMNYYMTSPEGEKYYAYWDIAAVAQPTSFTFKDGFAVDDSFTANPELPESSQVFAFADVDGATRATFLATYADAESLQKVLDMGAVEGSTLAINQIDDLLAA